MPAILDALFFLGTLGLLFFLPGFLILEVFFPKRSAFVAWEKFLLSFGLSLGLLDLLMLALGKLGLPLNALSIASGAALVVIVLGGAGRYLQKARSIHIDTEKEKEFSFSSLQTKLFLALLFLTIFLKIVYLFPIALPTATDLGHHMYWSKLIAVSGAVPEYGKQDVVVDDQGTYSLSSPQPIADFIIGEHLPFAALHIFSGLDFLSAFPVLFLLLVNLLGVMALVLLAYRLALDIIPLTRFDRFFTGPNIALCTLFFFGPLYSLASPQARFVSGGVVGNVLGNLFIPLILLLFFRGLREKNPSFLAFGFFLTFVLAYTHHLSTLILLFVLFAVALVYLIAHHQELLGILKEWRRIFLQPAPLSVLGCLFLFFLTVAVPTYLDKGALDTALGTPSKTTRTGLSFLQISASSGEARVALGLVGLSLLLFFSHLRKSYAGALLLGWGGILLVMTLFPSALFIDIPSNRIGSYLSFPLGLLAAGTLTVFYALLFQPKAERQKHSPLPSWLLCLALLTPLAFTSGSGSYDNGQSLVTGRSAEAAVQTYAVSEYLARSLGQNDVILKDHNYVTADAWMKTFFLRDYGYPLSRGLFRRYEGSAREQCTLLMIAVPNTPRGEKCFLETGTNYIVVNPEFDATQFEKSKNFSRVYSSDTIHVYAR